MVAKGRPTKAPRHRGFTVSKSRALALGWEERDLDQAHPEVQRYTFNVCQDIVSRYAVDGIHFDYVRYSDGGSSANYQPWDRPLEERECPRWEDVVRDEG